MNVNRYITSLPHNLPEAEKPKVGMCVFEEDESNNVIGYISNVFEKNVEIMLFDPEPLKKLQDLTDILFHELIPEKEIFSNLSNILDKDLDLLYFWLNLEVGE